jgi:hypothetical protein
MNFFYSCNTLNLGKNQKPKTIHHVKQFGKIIFGEYGFNSGPRFSAVRKWCSQCNIDHWIEIEQYEFKTIKYIKIY